METTIVTKGMVVRTADLHQICSRYDPRSVELACFLLHSSKGDAELAIRRALDGMFQDEAVQAVQNETASAVRAVALAAYDLRLAERQQSLLEHFQSVAQPG